MTYAQPTRQLNTVPPRPQPQSPAWAQRQYDHDDGFASAYPFVQWVNRGDMLEPRYPTGGFACPLDQNLPIPGLYAVLHHVGGATTEVLYSPRLAVAVLRTRFTWVKDGLRTAYVKGARGKLQALCLVRVEGGFLGPLMLTFTGLTGSRFNAARQAFAKAVRKATQGQAPAYAFWMALEAGEPEMVGKGQQQSPITPVAWNGDFDPERDYIGDAALDGIPWDEVEQWAAAWKSPGPNGEGEVAAEAEEGEEIPF